MEKVTRFFDFVYWLFMSFCKICFICMVLITAIVVFNRYFIKSQLVWGEPIVLMFMVYMSLVSAALAIRKDTHIRMQIVDFILPKKVVNCMRGAANIGIFIFGLVMIVYGVGFTKMATRNVITGVGIKSAWLYAACPISGTAICLMEIERLINFIYRIKNHIASDALTAAEQAQKLAEEGKAESENSLLKGGL